MSNVTVYEPTSNEVAWIKKNNLMLRSVPGVLSWYSNSNTYIHNESTHDIVATREFAIHTCCAGECDLVFESQRIDQRNGETLYKVYFKSSIVTSIEEAFARLEAKIKRFPDKKIYQLFNSVFVDKTF